MATITTIKNTVSESVKPSDSAIATREVKPGILPIADKSSAAYLADLWLRAKQGDQASFTTAPFYKVVAKVNNVILREVTDYSEHKPVRTEIVLVKPIKGTSKGNPKILGKMTPMGLEVCSDLSVDTVEQAAIDKANATWALELKEINKRKALEASVATNAEYFENDSSGVYVEL